MHLVVVALQRAMDAKSEGRILSQVVIVVVHGDGEDVLRRRIGGYHGGSKEEVYNKRKLEGYFEMHFKRN